MNPCIKCHLSLYCTVSMSPYTRYAWCPELCVLFRYMYADVDMNPWYVFFGTPQTGCRYTLEPSCRCSRNREGCERGCVVVTASAKKKE
jgi:hypothetical protein